jgi:extracellular factor (EF) 3-hydroxypalmitic acid methyl ester biosynthesis protein
MNTSVLYLQDLVNAGGPEPDQYSTLNAALENFNLAKCRGEFNYYGPDYKEDLMGKALSFDTMQGLAYRKPHGYAGDFELLERIYGHFLTPQSELKNWDQFWNSQAFVSAFQHSTRYFVDVVAAAEQHKQGMKVLNIASGSSRSVADYLNQNKSESSFLCMDRSWKALDYASILCRNHSEQVGFKHGGAEEILADEKYDLVWSEGLFDYLNDASFKLTLEKLLSHTRKGSEIVITNLSTHNPSQTYMDFLDWHVNPRSEAHMTYLATCCGIKRSQMHVVQDPSKVNMYLHIAV